MINDALIVPRHIVVVGASNDVHKPGGKVLKNLLDHRFAGDLRVLNARQDEVQGVRSYRDLADLPETDLAILAIPATACAEVAERLAQEKGTRAFVCISAGFSEQGAEGAALERRLVEAVDAVGGCLIGPNCTGVLTPQHASMFTLPADQAPLAQRDDILVYQSDPLAAAMEVTGYPEVILHAASSAADTDFFARLIDVLYQNLGQLGVSMRKPRPSQVLATRHAKWPKSL